MKHASKVDRRFRYRSSVATDLWLTFARVRREQRAKKAPVVQIKRSK